MSQPEKKGLGTFAVFLAAISAILGAILFLRMGYATGTLGFWGVLGVVLLGHMITIPTALAISELATNTRVEGGGEYYVISRSFGLNIGVTIGMALFLSQTISIAFYTIAFAESFHPLFQWFYHFSGIELPRQVISIPALLFLGYIIIFKGTGSGIRLLYIVNIILAISLLLFFLGNPIDPGEDLSRVPGDSFGFFNPGNFFLVFAICFPAFTGVTAGVGLSGTLRNPGKSIAIGTLLATLTGLIVYILVAWKLAFSASRIDLIEDQLIMSRIALFGSVAIPVGLAACTSSSAMGSMMVAPRTFQAIAADKILPFQRLNLLFARGKGEAREPVNASLLSFAIAFVFVLLGDVNSVAEVISMFFLITYGTLCLNSFLNHFGAPPSYRPVFRSRWYISLAGFLLSIWVMFMINPLYALLSYLFISFTYLFIERHNKNQKGMVSIFKAALFQLNRRLQVYMQKHNTNAEEDEWRPAAVCISSHSFERPKVLTLMRWLSYQHGFGTYFHFMEGYYSKQTRKESQEILKELIRSQRQRYSTLYIDTMVSPSYTSAIAQIIQTPSISGMENNMVVFEYDRRYPEELPRILENVKLVKAGEFDVCIFSGTDRALEPEEGIHVWIGDTDDDNATFMILLGYIFLAHPDWKGGYMRIYIISASEEQKLSKEQLKERIASDRIPVSLSNIEIVTVHPDQTIYEIIREKSGRAGLTLLGFREELIRFRGEVFFPELKDLGDTLFVNTSKPKEIR